MKKCIYIFCLYIGIFSISASAQKFEVGVWGGAANYFGDLNTNLSFQRVGPAAGVFVRNVIDTRFAFKHSFIWGQVEGSDALSNNEFQRQRNLSFRSPIFELSSQLEFNFLDFFNHNKKYWISPYLSTGVAVFFFDPQAEYHGKWYHLQPLGTEGQNDANYTGHKKYKLYNFAIPIGGGLKIAASRYISIGIDIQTRKTFTDYLDDVSTTYVSPISLPQGDKGIAYKLADRSGEVGDAIGKKGYQRGTSTKKDDYLFMGFTISYTFGKQPCPPPYPSKHF